MSRQIKSMEAASTSNALRHYAEREDVQEDQVESTKAARTNGAPQNAHVLDKVIDESSTHQQFSIARMSGLIKSAKVAGTSHALRSSSTTSSIKMHYAKRGDAQENQVNEDCTRQLQTTENVKMSRQIKSMEAARTSNALRRTRGCPGRSSRVDEGCTHQRCAAELAWPGKVNRQMHNAKRENVRHDITLYEI